MGDLGERQARRLAIVRRNQPRLRAAGLALVLLGGAYVAFGFVSFDPGTDPAEGASFDRPIAQLGRLYAGYQAGLRTMRPSTELERWLIGQVRMQTDVTTSSMVFLLRLFVGTLVLTGGFILLTVSVERGRLLALIRTLEE